MYRLIHFRCTNAIGFSSGLGKRTFDLDLEPFKDKDIITIIGDNAGGKSTFLSLVHPTHLPSDGRNKFIIPGKEGVLTRTYLGDDGTTLISKCVYSPKKDDDGHNAKCFLSIIKSGEDEALELNPNGNVTSYNALLYTYFGINKDYINFASYSDAVAGIVSMTDTERKNNVSSLIPNTNRFEYGYAIIMDKYKELRNLMRSVSQKISNIRDADSLDADLKRVSKELTKATHAKEDIIRKLAKTEGRVKEISHDQNVQDLIQDYHKMLNHLAEYDSKLVEIRNRLYRRYDELGLDIDPINPILFIGAGDRTAQILRYERKLARSELTVQSATARMDKIQHEISKTEREISEAETVLYSINTQDIGELKRSRASYMEQLDELQYTKNPEKYNDLSYSECIALSKQVSTLDYMIQAMYDEYGELVSSYFNDLEHDRVNEVNASLSALSATIESKSAKKDSLYRKMIEKEQYRKFQSILEQRPTSCKIDNCPFISTALKWASIADEIAELKAQYDAIGVEIKSDEQQRDEYDKYLSLRESVQNLIQYIQGIKDGLSRYMHVAISELYRGIQTGTWSNQLDMIKLKRLAAILSEKELYNQITQQRLPEIENAIKLAEVYGSNRDIMISQIDRMRHTLSILQTELSENELERNASGKMRKIYTKKLLAWRDISELLDLYRDIAQSKEQTSESAQARQTEIETIVDLVEKCKKLESELRDANDVIVELTPIKQQIIFDLTELTKLQTEKDQIEHDFIIVDIMKTIGQPGKGVRKELMNIYFYDIYQTANQLLLNTFNGKLRLHKFNITDKEFTIPFEYAGETGSDVAFASSSQRATIAIAISLAIISKIVDRYSIITFDESDQTLSPANKSVFVDILAKQMKMISINQAFVISHSPEYYLNLPGCGFIGFPGWDNDGLSIKKDDLIAID